MHFDNPVQSCDDHQYQDTEYFSPALLCHPKSPCFLWSVLFPTLLLATAHDGFFPPKMILFDTVI